MAKVRIETNASVAKIYIDDKEVRGVRGYTLTHTAGELPVLNMEFLACDTVINSPSMKLVLPECFEGTYVLKEPEPIPPEILKQFPPEMVGALEENGAV